VNRSKKSGGSARKFTQTGGYSCRKATNVTMRTVALRPL
jgi:hypothetical protein